MPRIGQILRNRGLIQVYITRPHEKLWWLAANCCFAIQQLISIGRSTYLGRLFEQSRLHHSRMLTSRSQRPVAHTISQTTVFSNSEGRKHTKRLTWRRI